MAPKISDSHMWKNVRDFINRISGSSNLEDFFAALFSDIGKIIPFDHSVQWSSAVNNEGMGFYDAFRTGNLTVEILSDSENSIEAVRKYNEHYRYLQPPPDRVEKYGYAVDYRSWENTEYYTDFIKPLGMRYGLVPVTRGLGHTVTIQRSSNPGFSEDEALLIGLISPHIDCIHSCLRKIEGFEKQLYSEIDLERLHCRLTPRQTEIFRLIFLHFSIAEIASYLCIGRRTVEKHIADVYEKMNIRSRYELFLIYTETEGKGPI